MQLHELTPEQKHVLHEKGTEAPFSGSLLCEERAGVYMCAQCGSELFTSDTKYESKTPGLIGWPSFSGPSSKNAIELRDDMRGRQRTEVICKRRGGHLGHVFPADDSPNGQHYCINSVCLQFDPRHDKK